MSRFFRVHWPICKAKESLIQCGHVYCEGMALHIVFTMGRYEQTAATCKGRDAEMSSPVVKRLNSSRLSMYAEHKQSKDTPR